MKYLKYLLIVVLIFSFAMVSCKKDSTTGPAGGAIVGTWNVTNMIMGWLLTTSSNQVATAIPGLTAETNISANTPTLVQFLFYDDDFDFGISTIDFKNDGTGTTTTIDEDGTEIENFTYTTDGDQLTMNESGDITIFEYSIDGNTLTMVVTDIEAYCEDYNSQAECFTETEDLFELTPGSLTAVSIQIEIILNKAAAKPGYGLKVGKYIFDSSKIFSKFKNRIENIK